MSTFYDRFRECAQRWPNNVALEIQRHDRVESYTYAEVRRMAESVGAWLAKSAVQPGSRVAILADNHPRWVTAFLGAVAAGCTAVPLDTALHSDQIATLLKDSGSSLLFCDVKHLATAAEAIASLPIKIVLTNPAELKGATAQATPVADLDSMFASGPGDFKPASVDSEHVASLLYTSGTTSDPKGVMLTHRNVWVHALAAVAELGLSERDTWAHVAPMFHLADAWASFAITWVGGRHVMAPKFEARETLATFERERVTLTNLVPTMLNLMVKHPDRDAFDHHLHVIQGATEIDRCAQENEEQGRYQCKLQRRLSRFVRYELAAA